jgi:hypothetical protein
MSDSREWQAGLHKVRKDLRFINATIKEWAGKPNKPKQVEQKLIGMIEQLDEVIPAILEHNPRTPAAEGMWGR